MRLSQPPPNPTLHLPQGLRSYPSLCRCVSEKRPFCTTSSAFTPITPSLRPQASTHDTALRTGAPSTAFTRPSEIASRLDNIPSPPSRPQMTPPHEALAWSASFVLVACRWARRTFGNSAQDESPFSVLCFFNAPPVSSTKYFHTINTHLGGTLDAGTAVCSQRPRARK